MKVKVVKNRGLLQGFNSPATCKAQVWKDIHLIIGGYNMERRIEIDGLTYICHVSHDGETEYWSVSNANVLAEFLQKQGYKVTRIVTETCPQSVWVDKNIRIFNDDPYFLNQCEGDLIEWIGDSMCGDFTNYYDKVLFNTEDGFVAAYRDDISNNWKF